MTITPQTSAGTEATARLTTHELSSELRISVARVSRRLRAEKGDSDLTDGQMMVLGTISLHGAQTLSQLSERERVTPPSMTRRVNSLVELGYVERQPSPDDGRKQLLTLSAAGAGLVQEVRRRRDEWLYKRLTKLTPTERQTLAEASAILRELADR